MSSYIEPRNQLPIFNPSVFTPQSQLATINSLGFEGTFQYIPSAVQSILTNTGTTVISATDGGCVLPSGIENGILRNVVGAVQPVFSTSPSSWFPTNVEGAPTSSQVINAIVAVVIFTIPHILVGGEGFFSLYNVATNTWSSVLGTVLNPGDYISSMILSGNNIFICGSFTNLGGSGFNNFAILSGDTSTWLYPTEQNTGDFALLNNPTYCSTFFGGNNCYFIGGAMTPNGNQPSSFLACWNLNTNSWDSQWGFGTTPTNPPTAPICSIDSFSGFNDGVDGYVWSQILLGGFGSGSSFGAAFSSTNTMLINYLGINILITNSIISSDATAVKIIHSGSTYNTIGFGKYGSTALSSDLRYTTSGSVPSPYCMGFFGNVNTFPGYNTFTSYGLYKTGGTVPNLGVYGFCLAQHELFIMGSFNFFTDGDNPPFFTNNIARIDLDILDSWSPTIPNTLGNSGGAMNASNTFSGTGVCNALYTYKNPTQIVAGGKCLGFGYYNNATQLVGGNFAYSLSPISSSFPYLTGNLVYQNQVFFGYQFSQVGDTLNLMWVVQNGVGSWVVMNPTVIGNLIARSK